ncbi:hypothetical protein HNQ56_003616 [Anaerotaenia torta]|uniref:immunoglobulin-like domain-containing protein n=1 Tax=Anaerotaenia torta TaxID=433293 RepID=UPI003D209AD4
MKKLLFIFGFFVILFSLEACGTKEKPLIPSDVQEADIDVSEDITFTTQYPVYGKDMEQIIGYIRNNTDEEFVYGAEYSVEKLIDGTWYQLPFPENTAWNAIGYILSPKDTNTEYVSLSFVDYSFTDGTYRILKQIGDKKYFAEFKLGESKITADTPYGFKKLQELDKNYSKEQAIQDGAVVVTYNEIINADKIKMFLEDVSNNVTSMLRVVQNTTEGDPIITDIIYVVGGENYYKVITDNSRDNFAGSDKGIAEFIYSYMITDEKAVYLSNHASWKPESEQDARILLYDPKDEIWEGLVPIVQQMTDDRLKWNSAVYKIFSSDGRANVILTDKPLEFGYSTEGYGEMRNIENKLNMAVKIEEAIWADEHTILFVCKTNTDMKYYEFFDITSRSVVSYTASRYDYSIENGEIIIPE